MRVRDHLLQGIEDDPRTLVMPVIISFVFHLIFFGVFILTPSHFKVRKFSPTVVNVSLVTLSQLEARPGAKPAAAKATGEKAPSKKAAVVKPAPKVETSEKKKATETVSVAPKKWSEKTSLKKETFKPSRVVKSAIKKIEEKAEASRPNPVAEAIDRLRGKVTQEEAAGRPKPTETAGPAEAEAEGEGIATGQADGGGKGVPEILVYQQEIAYHIRNNWVYPEQLAGQRQELEVRMIIKIMANGDIQDIRFDKRSGNRYLDDSAYKAVMKSNPLPALPKGYRYYTVVLGFTPSGLQ